MNTSFSRRARVYAQVGLETDVQSASPEKLIAMLFDGAHAAIGRARAAMTTGNQVARGEAISKALDIVANGLQAALNIEEGGELAANLYSLYDYVERCLLIANLRADVDKLNEADKILMDLGGAWKEMMKQRHSSPEAAASM